jgi:hypothetical protein
VPAQGQSGRKLCAQQAAAAAACHKKKSISSSACQATTTFSFLFTFALKLAVSRCHELPLYRRRPFQGARHPRRHLHLVGRSSVERTGSTHRTRTAKTKAARFHSHPIAGTSHPRIQTHQVPMAHRLGPPLDTGSGQSCRNSSCTANSRSHPRHSHPPRQPWPNHEGTRLYRCSTLPSVDQARLAPRRWHPSRLSPIPSPQPRCRSQLGLPPQIGVQACAPLPHRLSILSLDRKHRFALLTRS